MTDAASQHKSHAPKVARFMIVTVSDSRTPETDDSGKRMRQMIEETGQHKTTAYQVVKDEPAQVQAAIHDGVANAEVDIIVLNGGTGISSRDGTYEAVSAMLEKKLDGFGELFRMLSWEQVGSAAMLSRAVGGLVGGKVVFSLPGSPKAVELAMRALILPEAGHLLFESRR
jgi:molybdenum cofactor biosynthesis protein B